VRLSAHGLAVDVPPGWEARILRRDAGVFGEDPHPVVHLANFPLPEQRGDFGAGVVDHMRGSDVLVVLFEYGAESAHQPLFRHRGIPQLQPDDFDPHRLQRTMPGQAGAQLFFHDGGRAFCLYVVVADSRRAKYAAAHVNGVVAKFGITPK
jgi:hypothetical protein